MVQLFHHQALNHLVRSSFTTRHSYTEVSTTSQKICDTVPGFVHPDVFANTARDSVHHLIHKSMSLYGTHHSIVSRLKPSMNSFELLNFLRTACPLGASITILITLITCVIIVKANDIYVSGLTWPFLSDMGRDYPAYYVFTTGLTTAAILLVITWTFNWQYHMSTLPGDAKRHSTLSTISCIAGILANLGLPVLAFFDTSRYSQLHSFGAQWFFYLETLAILLNTIVSYKLYQVLTGLNTDMEHSCSTTGVKLERRKKTLTIQVIFFSLFFMAFLIYMPIGKTFSPPAPRLSIDDCIDKGLGEEYCEKTMRLNSTSTILFDNASTYESSQMRAAAQLVCILTLVGYSASFITNDYDDTEGQDFTPEAKIMVL
ncbi:Frag1/DRAM/Sfk1 [Plasmopara halstedii]|uniref:Frag1/DRAM/Sfk1 n=1 Tax=Plasmopara halstedii TaxID=4781 RepID=A0A0P1B0C6_PLAHL|nr:Frag1/DRAM/Sfk1 [Plasmopara halstedii]CEG47589.1 Frag1/DRAM/Sfk1 [Plasmopara halstedii]|eukprot:XP_024583958.1 Frag1/DRAM/Sfk1 [Plasmopara halstedii]